MPGSHICCQREVMKDGFMSDLLTFTGEDLSSGLIPDWIRSSGNFSVQEKGHIVESLQSGDAQLTHS